MKDFYEEVLGVKDFWLRFEWQHRGSPDVHGLVWLKDAPSIEQGVIQEAPVQREIEAMWTQLIQQVVKMVVMHQMPPPQVDRHVCNKPCASVEDFEQDIKELIATLRGIPIVHHHIASKPKMEESSSVELDALNPSNMCATLEDGDIELLTKRNDPLFNSHSASSLACQCRHAVLCIQEQSYCLLCQVCY